MKAKIPLLSALLLTLLSGSGFAKDADSVGRLSLEQAFASPPATARPFVHWYWHIPPTAEKITQDFERMPRGFARYGSPETLHAAAATLWARGADGLYTFNFYNTEEYSLLDEMGDPTRLAQLPKEFFADACSVTNNSTVSKTPLPLLLKAGVPGDTQLFIADDPANAAETSLELVFTDGAAIALPAITLNGQQLHELKSIRSQSGLTLSLSSAGLKTALKRGVNAFTFTSPSSATLTSLSVRVVPYTR